MCRSTSLFLTPAILSTLTGGAFLLVNRAVHAAAPDPSVAASGRSTAVGQDTPGFKVTYQNGPLGDLAPKGVPVWVSSVARVGRALVGVKVLVTSAEANAPRIVEIVASYPTTSEGGVGLGVGTHVADLATPESLATSLTTVVSNGSSQQCQVFATPVTGNWLQVEKASDILLTTEPVVKTPATEK